MKDLEIGEMHWSKGWTFKRLAGGAVRLRKYAHVGQHGGSTYEAVIPANEWISIVQHVGAEQTAEAFALARVLHQGKPGGWLDDDVQIGDDVPTAASGPSNRLGTIIIIVVGALLIAGIAAGLFQ